MQRQTRGYGLLDCALHAYFMEKARVVKIKFKVTRQETEVVIASIIELFGSSMASSLFSIHHTLVVCLE